MKRSNTGTIPVAIVGSTGRVGKLLCEMLQDGSGPQELRWNESLDRNFPGQLKKLKSKLVIDFSHPKLTLEVAKLCATQKIPLLVCTTGFSTSDLNTLSKTLNQTPWALVPNTSLGVYALQQCLQRAAQILREDFDEAVIVESHHKHKKDAPSGTALMLQQSLSTEGDRPKNAIFSVRAGTDVGTHRVSFYGPFEELHLSHQAQDRKVFALGALKIALKLYRMAQSNVKAKYPLTLENLYSASMTTSSIPRP